MIFKNELCAKVLNGEKTQTRRLRRDGDCAWRAPGSDGARIAEVRDRRCRLKWQVGQTYAVQPGRGKKAVGRIELLAIREESLRDIIWRDVMVEGVDLTGLASRGHNRNTDAGHRFAVLWDSINKKPGTRWADNPPVWALEFARIDD